MKKYNLMFLLITFIFLSVSCKKYTMETTDIAEQQRGEYYVSVQPIVVRSDKGEMPALAVIPEVLVERAYERVSIDFIFAEHIFLDDTKARDGIHNLDKISEIARKKGLIKYNDRILYMFFVNAIDGREGPMGMGKQNGNIIFIALGDKLPSGFYGDIKYMQAFVIAHEIGHNFGLIHAVDDPNVPDDVPNLQGDGPFEDRIDPKYSLNDYQIGIIKKSPLLHKK